MSTEVEGVRCRCGGKLQERASEVEFFGIDFGVKKVESCTECGTEYLPQETMEEVEAEVRKRGLFGLERRGRVSKSGNSLVIRIPQEIAKSMKLKRGLPIIIYPSDKDRLVVEVESQL
ncbi:MAG: AbrB/MazE/SpoVT family DNA-binding domain-containing protein [Nitrososphaerota archaeon]|nr:AbrB/MazE/SpoVT family DNA-binding domain-containing protein [Nitrososphaerota archaeon]MDG7019978.1 AbrB/MazE/SpoVT family DNA-binding domain-containing protein [Nitrososphaerota archaeon]